MTRPLAPHHHPLAAVPVAVANNLVEGATRHLRVDFFHEPWPVGAGSPAPVVSALRVPCPIRSGGEDRRRARAPSSSTDAFACPSDAHVFTDVRADGWRSHDGGGEQVPTASKGRTPARPLLRSLAGSFLSRSALVRSARFVEEAPAPSGTMHAVVDGPAPSSSSGRQGRVRERAATGGCSAPAGPRFSVGALHGDG